MCTHEGAPGMAGAILHDVEPAIEIDLEPVDSLVPAHCTGWRARHAMSARFPAAFIPNSVGSRFYL